MIALHDYELSGNCFKVRLLLALLGLPYRRVPVDFHPGREHKSARFLASVNPLGQLPVIDDDGLLLADSRRILVHLANRYDASGRWYPADPGRRHMVDVWLDVADRINESLAAARLHDTLGYDTIDIAAVRIGGHRQLRHLDDGLAVNRSAGRLWLAAAGPTIADLACFPYAALAHEGGVALDAYPAVRRWIWQLRHLPGFVGMAGIRAPEPALVPLIAPSPQSKAQQGSP
jgi:glutathione S-transferase